MINKIKTLLEKNSSISDWIIKQVENDEKHVFLIKDKVDMNRACKTEEYHVKLFVDFDEFRGDASFNTSPSDSDEDLAEKVSQAVIDAHYIKNKAYPLPEKDDAETITASDVKAEFMDKFDDIIDVIYKDYGYKSKVNSCELFANNSQVRVLTSRGVDVSYPANNFTFELVTDNDFGVEPVEIFRDYSMAGIDLKNIEEIVKAQEMESDGRAAAKRTGKIDSIKVILSGADLDEFFSFYLAQASAAGIYNGFSRAKKGQSFLKGREPFNLSINPLLSHSSQRKNVDDEGRALHPYQLFKDGTVVNLVGSAQFCHYLSEENLGSSRLFELKGEKFSEAELREGDYLEILAFSSFVMDEGTGDFGGEFRLAKLVKDGQVSYLTGGSISLNMFKVQDTMYYSKETKKRALSISPSIVAFEDVTVAG